MKAYFIIVFFAFSSLLLAQKEELVLPQQAKDAYILITQQINKATRSIIINTPEYNHKKIDYYLIKKASQNIKIELYTSQRSNQKLLAHLMLYENISVCLTQRSFSNTSIDIDEKWHLTTTLPLSEHSFEKRTSSLTVDSDVISKKRVVPNCLPYFK